MRKPIIGITVDLQNDSDNNKYSKFPWYAIRKNYADSILAVGGVPFLIPCQLENLDEILNHIDGLMVSGSAEDINPKFYQEEITYQQSMFNDDRAYFELALTKRALELGKSFLGICGGMQVLNVALGGNLIQHIPDVISDSNIIHEYKPCDAAAHEIIIRPDTMLSKIAIEAGLTTLNTSVNSTHHQALDRLGDGLIISAKATDGIIEAIELANHNCVIGVEWHPEYLMPNALDIHLLKYFVHSTY